MLWLSISHAVATATNQMKSLIIDAGLDIWHPEGAAETIGRCLSTSPAGLRDIPYRLPVTASGRVRLRQPVVGSHRRTAAPRSR